MSENVRVLANAESITLDNQAKEQDATVLFNLIHQLKAGQYNDVAINACQLKDPELKKVFNAIQELAVILEKDSYRLSMLQRQVNVFIENMEDQDRPMLQVS